MTDRNQNAVLTRAGCIKGAREILPLCTFVFVLAATFGVAARQAGLSITLASLMSAMVFAGGAQFAALALLGPPPAMVPLLLGTLAINARHLLLGASLAPWLLQLPWWQRLSAVLVLSDANQHARIGLDALLVGFFAAALTGGWRGRADAPAAIGAAVVTVVVGALGAREWSVLIGAVGGAAAGAWSDAHPR